MVCVCHGWEAKISLLSECDELNSKGISCISMKACHVFNQMITTLPGRSRFGWCSRSGAGGGWIFFLGNSLKVVDSKILIQKFSWFQDGVVERMFFFVSKFKISPNWRWIRRGYCSVRPDPSAVNGWCDPQPLGSLSDGMNFNHQLQSVLFKECRGIYYPVI